MYLMEANYSTILWWFLPHINMNQPWIYMCPTIPHPLPPPSPPHPAGLSQSISFECLLHPSNLHWSSILHMVIYMFQCHSPTSSHPLPLPLLQSPKVHSTHLCLFCCLTYRVIITIFLNYIQ